MGTKLDKRRTKEKLIFRNKESTYKRVVASRKRKKKSRKRIKIRASILLSFDEFKRNN